MPTQNYDGSWTGDDGLPYDMATQTNNSQYNARIWGDRTMDGPTPKPGTYDTGGLPDDVVASLLQKPGVRAGIAYFISKGERPNLNQVAALDQQIIPGYKNMGNEEVEDHSGRNLALALAGVGGAGALSGLTGFGSGLASASADAGAGAAEGAGSTLASMVPEAAAPAAASGAGAGSTLASITPDFIASNAPIAGSAATTAATAAAPAAGAAMSDMVDGIPDGYGSTPSSNTGNIYDYLDNGGVPNNPQMIPNQLATGTQSFDAPGSTISKVLGRLSNVAPDLSSSLGSAAQGIQNNRLQTGTLAGQYDNAVQAAQSGATAARAGALKQLAQSNYLLNGGFKPQSQSIQLNGQTRAIPQIGMAPLPASDAQKAAAANLQNTAQGILAPGGTATPLPFSSYGTPGTGESALQAGSAITSMLPAVKSIYNLFTQ